MSETYDVMAYNGTFIEAAKHDSEGRVSFQRVFYGALSRAANGGMYTENLGTEPLPISTAYVDSIEHTTAATAYHRNGMSLEQIASFGTDEIKSDFMQNPFGFASLEDMDQYVRYSNSLEGKNKLLYDPWEQGERLRIKTRSDMQDLLEIIIDPEFTDNYPDETIAILESELEFAEILATDHGLREEVQGIIAALKSQQVKS